jgi:hypothetical protein
MSSVAGAVLPQENSSEDVVAEMRRKFIANRLQGSSVAPLKLRSKVAPLAAPETAGIVRASKSIFDPTASAPVPQTAAVAIPVIAEQAAAAPMVVAEVVNVAPVAQAPIAAPVPKAAATPRRYSAGIYASVCLLATLLGLGTVYNANQKFAGEMYGDGPMTAAAEAFSQGKNYATFDLNINIRQLRDQHFARMTKTPDIILLGASHWQEADENLIKHKDLYNAHIHRDYWQDLFAMIEIIESHGRMPKQMIISLRDNQFMPIEVRRDFLWEPGIEYWRKIAPRLGVELESYWKSYSWQRLRERLSLSMLFGNITRWFNANELPHVTENAKFKSLDVLLPGGSIVWSEEHDKFFTQKRSKHEAETFADFKIAHPPVWQQEGLDNFEKLVKYIQSKGVEVTFVSPPFNPIYWDRVQNTAYSERLTEYVSIIKGIADRHAIKMIGSFNPHVVGCTKEQYIDAEHANATCLKNIFDEFTALDTANTNRGQTASGLRNTDAAK